MRQRSWAFLAAVPALAALGYWLIVRAPEPFSARLHAQICSTDSDRIALSDLTDFKWSEVVVLTPGTNSKVAEKALGFPWADYFLHSGNDEDVLIFLDRGRIVRTIDHPRIAGDFARHLSGRRLARDAAIFAARRPSQGCDFAVLDGVGEKRDTAP